MVIVGLTGGLGNQMFQYAAGKALSHFCQTDLKYHFEDHYKLAQRQLRISNFNISGSLLSQGEGKGYFPLRLVKRRLFNMLGRNINGKAYFEKKPYSFDTNFFDSHDDVYLIGFWQSYRYFESISDILKQEFTLKNSSPKFQLAVDAIHKFSNTVSIHVRRTDYTNPKSLFGSLELDYYKSALVQMEKAVGICTPVIFTDDPAWARDNFGFLKGLVFAADFHLEDFEELILMSRCSNNIIANSSFSWWGAWLNSNDAKLVIAPKNWHTVHTEESELMPDDWMRL